MIADYVAAGFRKIHLDCSMSCADDRGAAVRRDDRAARARLCAVAERAYVRAGGEPPVYVIGTEVPVPGGAAEELDTLAVTTPRRRARRSTHIARSSPEAGLGRRLAARDRGRRAAGCRIRSSQAWSDYVPEKARALSRMIEGYHGMVFEAHSTDYQTPSALAALVRDHFAILKVGPGVTFALREALWALDAIEREWIEPAAGLRLPQHRHRAHEGRAAALGEILSRAREPSSTTTCNTA